MKKIVMLWTFYFLFLTACGYCQQEKTLSAFEAIENVVARIQQIPDSESIRNATGTITLTARINESDYANLKSLAEKLLGKTISNPVKLEGNFVCMLPSPGEKIEKYMMAGKSELGSFFVYRNLDNLTILFPEMGIEIEDKISDIRKLSNKDVAQTQPGFAEGLGMLTASISFKTLFNQVKTWFYDANISMVEKSGRKLIELAKKDDGKDVKLVINPETWTFSQFTFSQKDSTITIGFKSANKQKFSLADYMPESIVIDTVDRGNTIKIEIGSLAYNKTINEGLFNLKRMKLSEFISSMTLKLMSQ